MIKAEPIPCGLCGRAFPPRELTKHHCLPREKGGSSDDVALICRQCHGIVTALNRNRRNRTDGAAFTHRLIEQSKETNMRAPSKIALVLIMASSLTSGVALANTCKTDHLRCATNMPDGGYCECRKGGNSEGGTVIGRPTALS